MQITRNEARITVAEIAESLALPDDMRYLEIKNWKFETRRKPFNAPRSCICLYVAICKIPGFEKLERDWKIDEECVRQAGSLDQRMKDIRLQFAESLAAVQAWKREAMAKEDLRKQGIILPVNTLPDQEVVRKIWQADLEQSDHLG